MTILYLRALAGATLACLMAGDAAAQPAPAAPAYQPSVGQPGKDVVWVPTPQALVDRMLDLARVTRDDYVIDLGSGDGRTVITAARRGARALGIEYNGELVELSRRNAAREGIAVEFTQQDLFQADLAQASVITMFLLPEINLKLRPRLLQLAPGARIVSNTFAMGDWAPDETATLDASSGCDRWCTALLWIVPAQFGGTHATAHGELALVQTFQLLSGTLRVDGKLLPVEGRVRGKEAVVSGAGRQLQGSVENGRPAFR
jgi:SAM-dependent methyltransferase